MEDRFTTGYKNLDEKLNGGFKLGSLTIIGGRPTIGKSTFIYNLLINNISNETYGALFSKDNSLVSIENNIKRINDKYDHLIYINDETLSLEEELLEIKVLKKVNPKLNLVVIDYLQLHNENIEKVIDKFKILASKLNIAIVIISQLSRIVEKRANKRPKVEDLKYKNLNSIDNILLLYRESYYDSNIDNKVDLLEISINNHDEILLLFNKKNYKLLEQEVNE